jgi:dipeptidyl aminopeptidase/acylaminoacyl peptidase
MGFVRFSPDGKRLAFVHYREPQSLLGTVCFMEVAGAVTVATQEYVNIHGLAWHDEQILFSASDDRPLFRSVLAVRPGGKPRILARVPVNVTLWDVAADGRMLIAQTDDRAVMIGRLAGDAHDRDLSWLDASWVADLSHDGSKVLFGETGQGVSSQAAAYLRGTDGTPAVRLGTGQPLALSPDKLWALVLNSDSTKPQTGSSIDMVPTGAGQSRRLLQGQVYASARWLPDGRGILIKMSVQSGPWLLYRLDLQKGEPRPVTPDPVREWVLSPDGTTIAATSVRQGVHLYSLGGDAVRTVPGTNGREELIGWIREGLLVTRRWDPASPRGEVHLLDPGTGRQRSWANILPGDDAGIMLMGTFVATPDGSAQVFTWHRALSNLYIAQGLA